MTFLRVFSVVVIIAIIAVAAIPLLVLVDLVGGGDGWGLCPSGIGSCETSYFDGFELVTALSVILFFLVALLRISYRVRRWIEERRTVAAGSPVPPPRPKMPRRVPWPRPRS